MMLYEVKLSELQSRKDLLNCIKYYIFGQLYIKNHWILPNNAIDVLRFSSNRKMKCYEKWLYSNTILLPKNILVVKTHCIILFL